MTPFNVPAHQQACRSGALSDQECRTGLVVRWGTRPSRYPSSADGIERLGADGRPLPPLTVPVSALLSGAGGTFRLADVFGVTPRPAPLLGNGNRRLLFPLMGSAVTTSGFGWRLHPLLGNWLMHAGRDLAAPEGTPVVAALSGLVISSGLAGGYGLAIEVEHATPRRRSLYGHLSELYVKTGDRVRQGEVIGRVGSTGLSTGPHLHFELRLPGDGGWVAVDPGDLDPGRAGSGSDTIALLMGQLVQSLERPGKNRARG
jgi:murein DD-endopeptidase MepM/ murein hydrolase activator NlpD